MVRHARLTLPDEQLDQLHALKRRLARERGHRLTLDELLHEGVELLLRHHRHDVVGGAGDAVALSPDLSSLEADGPAVPARQPTA